MVLLEMGSVVDYYRPSKGNSWCDMFTSKATKHEFSRDGVKWVTPADHTANNYGGSADNYVPDANANSDEREYLSFWGDDALKGGCCHSTYSDKAGWGQAFTITIDGQPPPLPRRKAHTHARTHTHTHTHTHTYTSLWNAYLHCL